MKFNHGKESPEGLAHIRLERSVSPLNEKLDDFIEELGSLDEQS